MDENRTEGTAAVAFCQARIGAVVQFVRDAAHSDALSGIAEGFGTGDKQNVVVGIVGHRRLVGRLEGLAHVLAEIHGEIGQIFQDDDIVLGGQAADDAQFLILQTYPTRVVRVGVDDGGNISLAQVTFQLVLQLVAAVVVHVEGLIFLSHYNQLLLLYGETGVDEQDGVFLGVALAAGEEGSECTLHGPCYGYAAFGCNVDVDKRLDETCRFRLESR